MPCGRPHCVQCAWTDQTPRTEAQQKEAGEYREKAFHVLAAILDEDNRARLESGKHLVITGSHGGRYAVQTGYSGNVYRLDVKGQPFTSYCAHPPMIAGTRDVPVQVAMVAQILAIQTDEIEFLRVAC
ncbi:hypothetical protein [Actinomadura sp. NEAU-AAG7]|uniref:hypothetical protein n=1 Tax=Actinomadura sp. NEAU-AAG7 TaxID=2839640 RepID=UPI001BE43D72|nr:hypothetical protein [Actinomadura sp. NEAU-AAG7]MBT2213488.1 hypothetical protein [Actinomadura sp. NEAU-AAG7]